MESHRSGAPNSSGPPQSFSPSLGPTGTVGQQHRQASSDVQDDALLPWYIIHPAHKPKLCWDIFAVMILLYAVVMTPVRLSFNIEDYCPNTMWILDTIIDIAFVLDLLFNFVTAVYVDDEDSATLTSNLRLIAAAYIRSWFAIDLISSAPVDLCLSLTVNGCTGEKAVKNGRGGPGVKATQLLRILRLVKLVKILRLLRLQKRFEELCDRAPILDTPIFKMTKPLFCSMYFAHALACGFFSVGASVYYESPPGSPAQLSSWISSSGLEMPAATCSLRLLAIATNDSGVGPDNQQQLSFSELWDAHSTDRQARLALTAAWGVACEPPLLTWGESADMYTASLYWTFTTITTVGYGDLTPKATSERAFAIFAMLLGTGIFGYVLSAMTHTLSDSFATDGQVSIKFKALQQFMDAKELPFELRMRIRRHFRYLWCGSSMLLSLDESAIIRELSTPLRAEALQYMYRALYAENPIFLLVDDPTFRDTLMNVLQPLLVSPGDVLVEQGTLGHEVFILTKGVVDVDYDPNHVPGSWDRALPAEPADCPTGRSPTAVVVGQVVAGARNSIVGEAALLPELGCAKLRSATARAREHCELYSVNASAFIQLCDDYPLAKLGILDIARERLAQISVVREASQSSTSPELVAKAYGFGRKLQVKGKEATARKKAAEDALQAATPRRTKNNDSQENEQNRWVGLVQYKRTSSDRRLGASPILPPTSPTDPQAGFGDGTSSFGGSFGGSPVGGSLPVEVAQRLARVEKIVEGLEAKLEAGQARMEGKVDALAAALRMALRLAGTDQAPPEAVAPEVVAPEVVAPEAAPADAVAPEAAAPAD